MQLSRGLLLNRLNEARIGLSTGEEETEQSNTFAFQNGKLTTFNGRIMVTVDSPLEFDVIVNAKDLLDLMTKLPDDEIQIDIVGNELVIKGEERSYGITVETENNMPLHEISSPSEWHRLKEDVLQHMIQGARICSKEEDAYLTKMVHISGDKIEASDNDRFYMAEIPTGFPEEVLIEADIILQLKGLELIKVSLAEGWVYFKTSSNAIIAVRTTLDEYMSEIDSIMEMKNSQKVLLPQNLKEIIERSQTFTTQDADARITIHIENGMLILTARKETGWAKEKKRLAYKGTPLTFSIPPKFLIEMLERTREVMVGDYKMKMTTEKIQFVVTLDMPGESNSEIDPEGEAEDDVG